jgi:hypothetical protein
MAENKKSFLAYCDWIDVFEELEDEEAGRLVKHLFRYVNDLNPVSEDKYTKLCFISIKQTLKRDLKKYKSYVDKQKANGKKGGRPLKKETQKTQALIQEPKKADSVSDSDRVNNTSIIYNENDFLEDWGKCRTEFIKQPTNIKKLDFQEKIYFADALKNYTNREVKDAMVCLFKQEVKNISAMFLRPKHFLESIDKYVSASTANDYKLYGSIKKINSGAL